MESRRRQHQQHQHQQQQQVGSPFHQSFAPHNLPLSSISPFTTPTKSPARKKPNFAQSMPSNARRINVADLFSQHETSDAGRIAVADLFRQQDPSNSETMNVSDTIGHNEPINSARVDVFELLRQHECEPVLHSPIGEQRLSPSHSQMRSSVHNVNMNATVSQFARSTIGRTRKNVPVTPETTRVLIAPGQTSAQRKAAYKERQSQL